MSSSENKVTTNKRGTASYEFKLGKVTLIRLHVQRAGEDEAAEPLLSLEVGHC